jgi:hypothetical protein
MKLFKVFNIKWADYGEDETLPMAYVYTDAAENIGNALSEEFGWEVASWDYEIVSDVLVFYDCD